MSIGLFGLMFGALVAGPLADRFGRKTVIICSSIGFGIFSLLCVTAHSLTELTIWRFLTGVGLGGAMPNALALVSEFSPRRRRSTMTVLALIGFNLGSALTGFIAAALIPAFGWIEYLLGRRHRASGALCGVHGRPSPSHPGCSP